jgi:GT2 family glycosyltransferase
MISIVVVTYKRKQDCQNLLAQLSKFDNSIINDIVLVDNSPELGLSFTDHKIYHIKNTTNLGVSKSRNLGIDKALNNIVWFLDDDVLIEDSIFEDLKLLEIYFNFNTRIAVLATEIKSPNDSFRKKEIPFVHYRYKSTYIRSASYFIGASFFVKKDLFEIIGGFDNECFYGFEETDLSYRLIKNNLFIKYYPYISVVHLGTPLGRMPQDIVIQNMYMNRVRIVSRNLPKYFLLSHLLIWYFFILFRHNFFLSLNFRFSKFIISNNPKYISYILKNGGRLFY